MSFSVSGDLPGRGLPEDSTQVRIGASNTFQIKHNPAAADDPPDSLSPYLRSDAFVQSEHAKIRQQASEILAEVGQDPRQRALALERWVFEAIDKRAVLSIPSALEVLEQRQGDCNEHAVLYTAHSATGSLFF